MTLPEANAAAEEAVATDPRLRSAKFTANNLEVKFANGLKANVNDDGVGIHGALDGRQDVLDLLAGLCASAVEADKLLPNEKVS